MDLENTFLNCNKQLWGTIRLTPKEFFTNMQAVTAVEEKYDFYGLGAGIEKFEKKMARILGKEDATFMPSGTMAQQIALRLWSDSQQNSTIMYHPLSHLEIHENQAIYKLHPHLEIVKVGTHINMITLDELTKINIQNATLLLELPQRELGGILPEWNELLEITSWCRNNHIKLHLDGARLWECTPFYQRSVSEIAKLFDSVYVSFYKGLGGLAGAILAGNKDFIHDTRKWLRCYGGNLISLYPYYISADNAYEKRIHKMERYYQKAIEIAKIFNSFSQVSTKPLVPQTNMFHVEVQGSVTKVQKKLVQIATQEGIKVIPPPKQLTDSSYQFEFSVGDESLKYDKDQFEKLLNLLFAE